MIDPDDIDAVQNDFKGLRDHANVFEPWCSTCLRRRRGFNHVETRREAAKCHVVMDDSTDECACEEEGLIFVGTHSESGDAWDAAGILFDLAQKQAKVIDAMKHELDQAYARDVRDEQAIAVLREDVARAKYETKCVRLGLGPPFPVQCSCGEPMGKHCTCIGF